MRRRLPAFLAHVSRPGPDALAVRRHHGRLSQGSSGTGLGCRCGIYAVISGLLDSLPGYLLDTAHKSDPWAYAEVACSGRVFLDKRGIRAERAEILRIALAESCWPDETTLADAKRRLYERYRVPISGLEGVPDWVTENRRGEGPPPDEETLDLDRLDLHV